MIIKLFLLISFNLMAQGGPSNGTPIRESKTFFPNISADTFAIRADQEFSKEIKGVAPMALTQENGTTSVDFTQLMKGLIKVIIDQEKRIKALEGNKK